MKNLKLKKQLLEKDESGNSIFQKYCYERALAIKNERINFYKEEYQKENEKIDPETKLNSLILLKRIKIYELSNYKNIKNILSFDITLEQYIALEQLRNSKKQQRKQIIQQLMYWVIYDYEIIFTTLTLNDDTLYRYADSNLENTKKLQDIVTRILTKNNIDYIGNVDYGSTTNRLHYHVLEAKPKEPREITGINNIRTTTNIEWDKYGFSNSKIVKIDDKGLYDVSSYLAKLTSHAIKVKKNRLFKKRDSEYKKYKAIKDHFKEPITIESIIKSKYAEQYQFFNTEKQEEIEKYEQLKLLEHI